MARQKKPKDTDKDQGLTLELTVPEALKKPQFANYAHSNVAQMVGSAPQVTLTFIHVYGIPSSATESRQEGEVVARVAMDGETALELKELLTRQLGELARRTRKRK